MGLLEHFTQIKRKQYEEKITFIGIDPYKLVTSEFSVNKDLYPGHTLSGYCMIII